MEKELTLGQELVGIKFNPDNRDDVHVIKSKFAEVIDILDGLNIDGKTKEIFVKKAIDEIITAQMWTVKAVTYKGDK